MAIHFWGISQSETMPSNSGVGWQTAARIEPEALGRPFDSTAHDVIRQMGCTTLEIGQHLANAEDIGQGV
jgi:hypothetical protein